MTDTIDITITTLPISLVSQMSRFYRMLSIRVYALALSYVDIRSPNASLNSNVYPNGFELCINETNMKPQIR